MTHRPILVTGGSGQVGGAIARLANAKGLNIVAPGRSDLDLTDEASLIAAVTSQNWRAVINCAAYTAVDKAESEPNLAHSINALAPQILARETARLGIPIIHVSTDYVFDGTKMAPYVESDPVNPLSVYGRSKEAGEAAVRANNPAHAIIRIAWVMSARGANFINTMLRLGAERPEMKVVDDQWGCPSSASDIAEALCTVATELDGRAGTWHFSNAGEATWHGLAAYIFAATEKRGLPTPTLLPITTAEFPTTARRPANSRLATQKIMDDFGISARPWQHAIDDILAARLD
ncbi:MAG: dTDP-4-dehydrorhamnose reductase [Chakrabartia sp.]